jgi:hypothetical protein
MYCTTVNPSEKFQLPLLLMQQAFNDLNEFLNKQQFQKGHSRLDPKHLPFGTPRPNKRAPLTNPVALYTLTRSQQAGY